MNAQNPLLAIREGLKVTQAAMAEAMGVPRRTYQDLEGGQVAVRDIHISAACWGALIISARDDFKGRVPETVRNVVENATLV